MNFIIAESYQSFILGWNPDWLIAVDFRLLFVKILVNTTRVAIDDKPIKTENDSLSAIEFGSLHPKVKIATSGSVALLAMTIHLRAVAIPLSLMA